MKPATPIVNQADLQYRLRTIAHMLDNNFPVDHFWEIIVRDLRQALEFAEEQENSRPYEEQYHCYHCRRIFFITMNKKEHRDRRPEVCVECWESKDYKHVIEGCGKSVFHDPKYAYRRSEVKEEDQ